MPTIPELNEILNQKQIGALGKIFDAKSATAQRVMDEKIDPGAERLMQPSQLDRLYAERMLEAIRELRDEAKREFHAAAVEWAEKVVERKEALRELLFGSSREFPLEVRLGIQEKSEEELLRLIDQAVEANDTELLRLALLGAHLGDHPLAKVRIFELAENVGVDENISELYSEYSDAPDDEALERLVAEDRFDVFAAEEPSVEDLAGEAKRWRLLTA